VLSCPNGEVVTAEFQITDALFMSFTKTLARGMTKNILEYADTQWPQAAAVEVQGSFPTNDAYGTPATAWCWM
jgi:hypothetical protein